MIFSFFVALFGAMAGATATMLDKLVLRVRKIDFKLYQSASFLGIVVVMAPLILFFWKTNPGAFELKNILIFLVVIIASVLANAFAFYSLKWEKITNLEPARLLEPFFTILLAILFSFIFGQALYERNAKIVIPALIAAGALVFSHLRKHHLEFNRYFIFAILGALFFAFELALSRLILNYYSPLTFYFIRCLMIFIFSIIIFRPNFKKIKTKRVKFEILASSAIWVIFRVLLYYGYLKLGVILTTLLVMLSPIFIYLFAWKFLKEKIDWRNIVAAIIIIASILYALLA
ncbi:MAG: EamA family transporter [Nanoarchaeota archaeon]